MHSPQIIRQLDSYRFGKRKFSILIESFSKDKYMSFQAILIAYRIVVFIDMAIKVESPSPQDINFKVS